MLQHLEAAGEALGPGQVAACGKGAGGGLLHPPSLPQNRTYL